MYCLQQLSAVPALRTALSFPIGQYVSGTMAPVTSAPANEALTMLVFVRLVRVEMACLAVE